MDTAQWPQEIVVKPIEEIVTKPSAAAAVAAGGGGGLDQNRKTRGPQKEQALNCPRCNSTNTKFCYYNNYSLTQPRYFCKTCRRYWTEGGSLRNIPVGGGSRKNKRSSSSSPNSTSSSYNNTNNPSSKKLLTGHNSHHIQDHHDHHQNPSMIQQDHQGQDLNLAFPSTTAGTTTTTGMIRSFSELMQLPNIINDNSSSGKNQISAMELLTGISSASRGLTSFPMQDPTNHMVFTPGFPVMNHQDFKPSLNFSLDGIDQNSTATGSYGVQESDSNNGMIRSLFPFEDLKNVSSTTTTTATTAAAAAAEHGGDHSGYWTGMLGGGSWF